MHINITFLFHLGELVRAGMQLFINLKGLRVYECGLYVRLHTIFD